MTSRARTPCRHTGCVVLLPESGYCEKHQRQVRQQSDERRGSASSRGYNSVWRKARETWLSRHPLCAECKRSGHVMPASIVDHIIPHRGDQDLFWDTSNWQSLCARCHSHKTASEDGGFGNKVKS